MPSVDISGVFSTPFPPFSYRASNADVTFVGDTMHITPSSLTTETVTVTATDKRGEKTSATFTYGTQGIRATVPADTLRDDHYAEVGGKMVRTTLLEPAATNLVEQSEGSAAGWWVGYGSGAFVGGRLYSLNTGSSTSRGAYHLSIPCTSGATYYYSCEAKADQKDGLLMAGTGNDALGYAAGFDLTNGTVVGSGANVVGTAITPVGDGYYRCELWAVATSAVLDVRCYFSDAALLISTGQFSGTTSFATGEGLFLRRVNVRQSRTSHVPTYGAVATRQNDRLKLAMPAWTQGAKTLHFKFVELGTADVDVLNWGTDNPHFRITRSSNSYKVFVQGSTTGRISGTAGLPTSQPGDLVEIRAVWRADGVGELTVAVNGGTAATVDTSVGSTIPATLDEDALYAGFRVLDVRQDRAYAILSLDAHEGEQSLAYCNANPGNLLSYRPGDDVAALGGTYTRPSPATYTARNPAAPTVAHPGDGWLFAFPDEAFVAGRVPLRDATGAVVGTAMQGTTDAADAGDPALARAGWDLAGGDSLRVDLAGALDVTRTASDVLAVLTTTDDTFVGVYDPADINDRYTATVQVGNGNSASGGSAGAPTFQVDGVAVSPATRGDLYTAVSTGSPVALVVEGADLSTWTAVGLGSYSSFFDTVGVLGAVALRLSGTAASAASRTAARDYVRAELARRGTGVTLP